MARTSWIWVAALTMGCTGKGDDSAGADDSATDDSGTDDSATDDSGTDDSGPTGPYDTTVVINEILAINNTTNLDENDQHEDWIELYNTGTVEADVGGFLLGDGIPSETPWTIPAGSTIEPGGYLLVWADEDPDDGALHADFKLDGPKGETVTLLDPNGFTVDEVTFGTQTADIAWARSPDGGEKWKASPPTPRTANP